MGKDPWDLSYKLVTKKLVGRRQISRLSLAGRVDAIVNSLFPTEEIIVWPPGVGNYVYLEVICEEIILLSRKIPTGKASGLDHIW